MSDDTEVPCPVCGAKSGGNECPLQPQWSDTEAMAHLCSSGLDNDKRDFWAAAVLHYASEGHLVVDLKYLRQQVLSRKGERPMTFSAVVHSLIEKGELVPVQGHERWRTGGLGSIASAMLSILWKGVVTASSVLWRSDELYTNLLPPRNNLYVFFPSLNTTRSFSDEDTQDEDMNGRFISPKALHSVCTSLLDWANSPKRRRFDALAHLPLRSSNGGDYHLSTSQAADDTDYDQVQEDGGFSNHYTVSFEILLKRAQVRTPVEAAEEQWLVADHLVGIKRATLYGDVVRVGSIAIKREGIASQQPSDADRSADIAVLRLRKSIEACGLLAQVLKIQAGDAREQALHLKQTGHVSSALVQMRRYKKRSIELEKTLVKEHTLENHLIRLEGLRIDLEFLETVEVATLALRTTWQCGDVDNKTLLQRVDDTMLDMQEEQKKQDELADRIGSMALSSVEDYDDDEELERELEELLNSDEGHHGNKEGQQPIISPQLPFGGSDALPAGSPLKTTPPSPCIVRREEKYPEYTELGETKKLMPA